jgi:hypothetical protein
MKIKTGSNKSFGVIFGIFFLIIFVWLLLNGKSLNYWFLSISIVFLSLGLLNSKILSPLNRLWAKFGILLGKVISPLVMIIVYFGVVTPISIIMKLFKKDVLMLKKNDNKTYWITKDNKIKSSMKNQY